MKLYNTTTLAGALVLALASASACNRTDRDYSSTATTTETTASNGTVSNTTMAPAETTIAQNDSTAEMPKTMDNTGSVPPVAADEGSGSGSKDVTKKTTTKKTMKKKHMKKSHETSEVSVLPSEPIATNDAWDSSSTDDIYAQDDSLDASQDFDETVSGTTMAPTTYRETGLSPFAQEPFSRTPSHVGSGQITGEDKSTTILDAPGLFQDPAAMNRALIQ